MATDTRVASSLPESHDGLRRSKPCVGISACLMGNAVRYDGGHKRSALCTDQLNEWLTLIPYCPEFQAGLGVPRQPIDLFDNHGVLEAQDPKNPERNPTIALQAVAEAFVAQNHELHGYILMQRSPSCALKSARVYQRSEEVSPHPNASLLHSAGTGVFVKQLSRARPDCLLIEEQDLQHEDYRLAFLCTVYLHHAWHKLKAESANPIFEFRNAYGYLVADLWPASPRTDKFGPSQDQDLDLAQNQLHDYLQRWLKRPPSRQAWLQRCIRRLHDPGAVVKDCSSALRLADLQIAIKDYNQLFGTLPSASHSTMQAMPGLAGPLRPLRFFEADL